MSAQPEALRLADEYASDGWIAGTRQWCEEAAAELRRQHAEIEQLLEALKWISNRCPAHMEDSLLHPIHQEMAHDAGACARAAIAKCQ